MSFSQILEKWNCGHLQIYSSIFTRNLLCYFKAVIFCALTNCMLSLTAQKIESSWQRSNTCDTRSRNWHHKSTDCSNAGFWYVCHAYLALDSSGFWHQKFSFQMRMVCKTRARKWSCFMVPFSGACVVVITLFFIAFCGNGKDQNMCLEFTALKVVHGCSIFYKVTSYSIGKTLHP